jgi:hypothetical protein
MRKCSSAFVFSFLSFLIFSFFLFNFSFLIGGGMARAYVGVSPEVTATTSTSTAGRAAQTNSLNQGLVGYWTMDGKDINWATNKIIDRSGYGNTGTLVGLGKATSSVAGKVGQAVKFIGSNTKSITLTSPASFNSNTGGFSYAGWINLISLEGNNRNLLNSTGDAQNIWYIHSSGVQYLQLKQNSSAAVHWYAGTQAVSYNKWQFLTVVVNNLTHKVYFYHNGILNRSLDITESSDLTVTSSKFADNGLLGSIDDVRVYNRALSAGEVKQLYNQGAGSYTAVSPAVPIPEAVVKTEITGGRAAKTNSLNQGLVAYYTMDGKDINWTTNTIKDRSGNGTIYYNTVTVSGTLTPDATGVYTAAGLYNGLPYYRRGSDNYWIWYRTDNTSWVLSTVALGNSAVPIWFTNGHSDETVLTSTFSPNAPATGSATVANNTSSGTYHVAPTTATLVGLGKATSTVAGKVGQGIKFDGVSGRYVDLGTSPDYTITNSYTISSFVKLDRSAIDRDITIWNAGIYDDGGAGYALSIVGSQSPDRLTFSIDNGPSLTAPYIQTNLFQDLQWHQVTTVINVGATSTIYVDGKLLGSLGISSVSGPIVPSKTFKIAYGYNSNNKFLRGSVDDVRVYNRVLSAGEVKQLYNQGAGSYAAVSPQVPSPAATVKTEASAGRAAKTNSLNQGLVGYWTMDGKDINWTNNTIVDRSGNGTTYYNTVTVSGTLSPDSTGVYTAAGLYNGLPYYRRGTDNYYVWWNVTRWILSPSVGDSTDPRWRSAIAPSIEDTYLPANANAVGNATVANNTSSGTYYVAPRTATLVGLAKATSTAPGKVGQAMKFNGVSSYVDTGLKTNLGQKATVSMWVNFNQLRGVDRDTIIGSRYYVDNEFSLDQHGGVTGYLYFTVGNGKYANFIIPNFRAKNWYYVTLVYDSAQSACNDKVKFYVSGSLVNNNSCTGITTESLQTTSNLRIGFGSSYNVFNGSIDDVRVYNRALSAAEVKQLYNQGR